MVTVMLAQNNKFKTSVRVLLLGAPLFLAACHSDFGPFPMPSGYTHHDKLYKAPPGPEPVLKKIEHSHIAPAEDEVKTECAPCGPMAQADMIVAVPASGDFDHAAQDLITRLVNDFGRPAEPVYLRPASPDGMEMSLEKALRTAMADKGFTIAPAPGLGPFTLNYAISALGMGDGSRTMVTVSLTGADGVIQEVSGIYALGAPAPMPEPVVINEADDMEPATVPVTVVAPGEPMPIGPLN